MESIDIGVVAAIPTWFGGDERLYFTACGVLFLTCGLFAGFFVWRKFHFQLVDLTDQSHGAQESLSAMQERVENEERLLGELGTFDLSPVGTEKEISQNREGDPKEEHHKKKAHNPSEKSPVLNEIKTPPGAPKQRSFGMARPLSEDEAAKADHAKEKEVPVAVKMLGTEAEKKEESSSKSQSKVQRWFVPPQLPVESSEESTDGERDGEFFMEEQSPPVINPVARQAVEAGRA